MDYQQPETHYVRCLKCQKVLKCSRYNTSALLNHIKTDHPEIEIVDSVSPSPILVPQATPPRRFSDTINFSGCSKKAMGSGDGSGGVGGGGGGISGGFTGEEQASAMPATENDNANVIYTRSYKLSAPPTPIGTPRKRHLYRTSIEKWRPANGTIYCPKCGCSKRPLIKTRSERFATNSCGAACILGCWPFCFLPFLCPSNNPEYLHCANCKNFLGLYDRDNNCVKPNREFVDQSGSPSARNSSAY